MNIKWLSRKLFAFVTLFIIAVYFKYIDKLSDLYFTIIILVNYITYLYVQGKIDLQTSTIDTPYFKYKKEDKNET